MSHLISILAWKYASTSMIKSMYHHSRLKWIVETVYTCINGGEWRLRVRPVFMRECTGRWLRTQAVGCRCHFIRLVVPRVSTQHFPVCLGCSPMLPLEHASSGMLLRCQPRQLFNVAWWLLILTHCIAYTQNVHEVHDSQLYVFGFR